MQHNPIEQLAPLTIQAGFEQVTQGDITSWLHYVHAITPDQSTPA